MQPTPSLHALLRCTHKVQLSCPRLDGRQCPTTHKLQHPLLQVWQAVHFEAPASLASLGSWSTVCQCVNCTSASSVASRPSCSHLSASKPIAKANKPKQRAGRLTSHSCQPIATSCPRQVVHVCPQPTTVISLLQTALGRSCMSAHNPQLSFQCCRLPWAGAVYSCPPLASSIFSVRSAGYRSSSGRVAKSLNSLHHGNIERGFSHSVCMV